jgi:peptidoglycan/xylan/chitin deacetylase (PgdA/CDA1 family)
MTMRSDLWRKLERHLARYSARRTVPIALESGVVCFTFDDLQSSACNKGMTILERYDVKGTFYVCGQLTGWQRYHTHEDLRRLANNAHELACHGFGHASYQSINKAEILDDLRQNEVFFQEYGYGEAKNFAYPYGHVSPFAKRIASPMFTSLRGIHPGINSKVADLALLRAFPLYEGIWSKERLVKLLERNAEISGLTIFFSHGIVPDPGVFDCSDELLEFAVRLAIATGNKVMPVREAIQKAVEMRPTGLKD